MIKTTIYNAGKPHPLGATWDGKGVNFAIYSENAEAVELCLFNFLEDDYEVVKINLKERTHHVWHIYLPELCPGQLYAYRIYGPYEPENGHRFNPYKLLLDPYAKAIAGKLQWDDSVFGYEIGHKKKDLSFCKKNSAPYIPKCVVVDDRFDWEDDKPLEIPYHETILYEAHVKGLTYLHPEIPENIRGTYAAIAHPAIISYLRDLGITTLELMPVHTFIDDRSLVEKGLSNFWGYNTIGFFSPDARYSSTGVMGEQVTEFKQMVKTLHKAGIEVIIDVVYNHTAEGNHLGPTLSFKGIDNAAYYRLTENKRYYMDYTGTGNTLNSPMPNVLKFMMDSLRYWLQEMHVDGFRFDLAATLARELHEVDRLGAFFDIIHQDPIISQCKLIAEPWDVGEGGFQVGKFPHGWAEWNGLYRDCVRDFWRGATERASEFSNRVTGSPDLYKKDFRNPGASINFITAHDGFTLRDLVSYNEKHNEANQENNADGSDENFSCNYGVEGHTDDPEINQIRAQQQRNLLTTLFLSQGIPMLLSGDESGNTQNGNNNVYCHDSELSWINWQNADTSLLEFTKSIIAFRKQHPAFKRRRWFLGQPIRGIGVEDIVWFDPHGSKIGTENIEQHNLDSFSFFLNGLGLRCLDENGEKMTDTNLCIIVNAKPAPFDFVLPDDQYGQQWKKVVDTSETGRNGQQAHAGKISVPGRSIIVLESMNTSTDKIPPESLPEISFNEAAAS